MYGTKCNSDFKNLLMHQKLRRHQKTNTFYDDKVWMPITMCGFDGAEHMDSVIGTVNIVFFNTQTYCKALQDLGISTAASQQNFTFMQLLGDEKIGLMLPHLN